MTTYHMHAVSSIKSIQSTQFEQLTRISQCLFKYSSNRSHSVFLFSFFFFLSNLLPNRQFYEHEFIPKSERTCMSLFQDWDDGNSFSTKHRIWYTLLASAVQYVMPLAVIIVLYYKIYIYLKACFGLKLCNV